MSGKSWYIFILKYNLGVFSNRYKSLAVNRMKDFKTSMQLEDSEILSLKGNQMKR